MHCFTADEFPASVSSIGSCVHYSIAQQHFVTINIIKAYTFLRQLPKAVDVFHEVKHYYDAHDVRVAFMAGTRRGITKVVAAIAVSANK